MKGKFGLLLGSASFFVTSLIVFGARFATSVLIARALGAEGKGVYTLVLTTSTLLGMVLNLGLGGAFTYLRASNKFTSSQLFSFALLSAAFFGLAGGGVFYLVYMLILDTTLLAGTSLWQMGLVLALNPVILLTSFQMNILLGEQRIPAYNSVDILRVVSNLLLQIGSSLLSLGITGAIGAWILSNLLAFLRAGWLMRGQIRLKLENPRPIARSAFSYGIKSYAANLTMFFNYRLDSFLVNLFAGPASVGLYTTGVSTAEVLWYIPNAVSSTLFPKASGLETRQAHQLTAQACRLVLVLLIPIGALLGVAGIFLIPWVYTRDFEGSVPPFLILLPGIIGVAITKIISASLSGRGKPQYSTYTSLSTLVITVLLDLVLIPVYGIIGAAVASTVSYLASAGLSLFWFSRETGLPGSQVIFIQKGDLQFLFQRVSQLTSQIISRIRTRAAE